MASYGTGQPPAFESPYKPPSGLSDLMADMEQGSAYPYQCEVSGSTFRHHAVNPNGMVALVTAQSEYNPNKKMRLQQTIRFVHQYIHPDDAAELMIRLTDPDDPFGVDELYVLMREIGKAGTARPIPPSCRWRPRR